MGRKFVDLAVSRRFRSKFDLGKPPALPGAILRGPKNRSPGCPATNKVLECLLKCPKTIHKHYGNLPRGPRSSVGPSKSNFAKFALFQPNLPYKTARTVLRNRLAGTQKLVVGVPAREKVTESLLWVPKGPHNHYGTLPWGPRGTLGPAKSKIFQISP